MIDNTKKKGVKPFQAYLMIASGVALILIRFVRNNDHWSTIDMIKVGFGVFMIGYGIYSLMKKK